jgi:hypothetical protein
MYIELESNSNHDSARLVLHGAIGPSELAPGIAAIDKNAFENARCEENSILFSISQIAHRRHVPTCAVIRSAFGPAVVLSPDPPVCPRSCKAASCNLHEELRFARTSRRSSTNAAHCVPRYIA